MALDDRERRRGRWARTRACTHYTRRERGLSDRRGGLARSPVGYGSWVRGLRRPRRPDNVYRFLVGEKQIVLSPLSVSHQQVFQESSNNVTPRTYHVLGLENENAYTPEGAQPTRDCRRRRRALRCFDVDV